MLTGLVGVGGGFLIVPALVLLVHLPMHKAVGTSLATITLNSAAGFYKHAQVLPSLHLQLDWHLITLFGALGIVGSLTGGAIARYVPHDRLRRMFGVFLVIMASFLLWKNTLGTLLVNIPKPQRDGFFAGETTSSHSRHASHRYWAGLKSLTNFGGFSMPVRLRSGLRSCLVVAALILTCRYRNCRRPTNRIAHRRRRRSTRASAALPGVTVTVTSKADRRRAHGRDRRRRRLRRDQPRARQLHRAVRAARLCRRRRATVVLGVGQVKTVDVTLGVGRRHRTGHGDRRRAQSLDLSSAQDRRQRVAGGSREPAGERPQLREPDDAGHRRHLATATAAGRACGSTASRTSRTT